MKKNTHDPCVSQKQFSTVHDLPTSLICFGHVQDDGSLTLECFSAINLQHHHPKPCAFDRARGVRIKNMSGRPKSRSGCRERPYRSRPRIPFFLCTPRVGSLLCRRPQDSIDSGHNFSRLQNWRGVKLGRLQNWGVSNGGSRTIFDTPPVVQRRAFDTPPSCATWRSYVFPLYKYHTPKALNRALLASKKVTSGAAQNVFWDTPGHTRNIFPE